MRKTILGLLAALSFLAPSVAAAQVCPAVAALPDSERRVAYSPSASTGPFSISFAILADSTDYSNWIEVWLNGVRLTGVTDWQLTIPSGTLATACRPITNASITLTTAATGTLQIVGARRPRRTSQFAENQGVSARNLNQVITDIVATERETWDKINDVTGRALIGLPGESITTLPSAANRASKYLGFDATGLIPTMATIANMTGGASCTTPGDFLVSTGIGSACSTANGANSAWLKTTNPTLSTPDLSFSTSRKGLAVNVISNGSMTGTSGLVGLTGQVDVQSTTPNALGTAQGISGFVQVANPNIESYGGLTALVLKANMVTANAGLISIIRGLDFGGATSLAVDAPIYGVYVNNEASLHAPTGVVVGYSAANGSNTWHYGFQSINADTAAFIADSYIGTGVANMRFRTARGTPGAVTTLQSGDVIGYIENIGAQAAATFSTASRAGISFITTELWTGAANGALIKFQATPTGTQSTADVAALGSIGLGVGNIAPAVRGHFTTDGTNGIVTTGASRFAILCEDTTALALGNGCGIGFYAVTTSPSSTGQVASIKGIKENATNGNAAGALVVTVTTSAPAVVETVRFPSTQGELDLGVSAAAGGLLKLYGSTSGFGQIKFAAIAGSGTLTFPNGTTDFSATGGTSQVVKQILAGGAFTVARLACGDLSDAAATCSSASGGSIVVGTTTITSGTNTRILYDNSGVVGEYTVSGTGTTVPLTASPTFTGTVGAAAITATSTVTGLTFVPTGSSAPTNGMYLGAANQLNWSTNSTLRWTLNSSGNAAFTGQLAVAGAAIGVAGVVLDAGDGTGQRIFRLNGGATNASDGSAFYVANNSVTVAGFGNKSSLAGGAYDATFYFYSANSIEFATGGTTTRLTMSTTVATLNYATAATSVSTGALVLSGASAGLGVAGAGYFGGEVATGAVAVASLPTCNAAHKAARHFVTDANATFTAGIGGVVAAGGANNVPVTCDGTNWRIGANDNIPANLMRQFA